MKKKLLLLLVSFSLIGILSAQPGFEDEVEDTPIDSSIFLLLGAGIVFGSLTLVKKSNWQNPNSTN